jgi:ATP-dependent helicase/nuclease subunit B
LSSIQQALREVALPAGVDATVRAAAIEVLERIETQVRAMRRGAASLPAQLQSLRQAISALGMSAALEADAVGRAVIAELDRLEHQLNAHRGSATLADLRALLTQRFEETAYVDLTVDSPVVMVTLAVAALRRFDAIVLIGADAAHLPASPAERLFLSNAVRADLGLATAETAALQAAAQLAAVLTSSVDVLAAWRARIGEESNPVSPLLERLQLVCTRASGDDLVLAPALLEHEVLAEPELVPHPVAPQLLPRRVSASAAQSLVDCPYQFYARYMLQLEDPEDVIELPDKRDFGIALHEVLRRFHRTWGDVDFSVVGAAELEASLRAHARQVFDPQLARMPGLLAYQRRFDGLVAAYVEWLRRHAAAGWRWAGGEQAHRREVVLTDGQHVELAGRIDRVDRHSTADSTVLIDYKARDATVLRRGLSVRGEDVQLPFYGALLEERPDSAAYLSFERARDGEGGVADVAPNEPFDELVEAVLDRLKTDLQRIADGAALPAIGGDAVCRRCEMHGLCRRHHWAVADETDGSP